MEHHYDLLVVGAGPAGLATAITATRAGARVLLVERRAAPSSVPRATHLSVRTMEILRGWGLAGAVRAAGVPVRPDVRICRTLPDPDHHIESSGYPPLRRLLRLTPELPGCCPQDHLEPLLAAHLRALGGTIVTGEAAVLQSVGPAGVRARVGPRTVRARFVVGADGSRSGVRERLGIAMEPLGELGSWVSVLLRADLDRVVGEHRFPIHVVRETAGAGLVLPAGGGRWIFAQEWSAERGEHPDQWTPERIRERVRLAADAPDLDLEVLGVYPFTMAAALATAFRAGPGFLVGDAAHPMTPVNGMGLNAAIADGFALGWRLALVADGTAGEALLDGYEAERRPVDALLARRSLRTAELPADRAAEDVAGRIPHAPVRSRGVRSSTLDLVGDGFVLLTRPGHDWAAAAAAVSRTSPALRAVPVDDPTGALELPDGGALLVRPDGVPAWRGTEPAALPGAVAAALGHADEEVLPCAS
ncbi:FAD-dependent monooxygenase [Pseudonocardia broussonetiae]|uniref:FAD-dependent oxidoreductase n=1 Tax=Pseudonocardia broussonetiae TaxID=2736640 RepID=A0A6M6JJI2_9PSEU|nr:FAD-dependent monooxygenase [Pseudonocardia broussonetiae]QJY46589.1 FAD-dependent oxidoreductase [Pseudonocardia broussonetiae]